MDDFGLEKLLFVAFCIYENECSKTRFNFAWKNIILTKNEKFLRQ